MAPLHGSTLFPVFLLLSFVSSAWGSPSFNDCLLSNSPSSTKINDLLHEPSSPNFRSILESSLQNLRFDSPNLLKPEFIITPRSAEAVGAAVICSKNSGLQIRTRSGGHDYEGLSYTADEKFVIIDLSNFRYVNVNVKTETAVVGAGATLGELYHGIGNKSRTLGFPAGVCATIGAGGHFSGGGQGTLMRKYGLSADNIIDAVLVNAKGQVLRRKSMGEDLFWAIRGGGGASFGVIVEFTITLVRVPAKVTVFNTKRALDNHTTHLVYKWQQIAPTIPDELFIRLIISTSENSQGKSSISVTFNSLFLGSTQELMAAMGRHFPELKLEESNCQEMSWVESTMFFLGYPKGKTIDVLLNRKNPLRGYFKGKSDYVAKPIGEKNLRQIWKTVLEGDTGVMLWDPYGGKMSRIPENQTPFPHREGVLFNIQYYSNWQDGGNDIDQKHIIDLNKLYNFMTPFVTKNPRTAYLNYRDLSIGVNTKSGPPNYNEAKVWGEKYFKSNFKRLAQVKAEVDPDNFFRNEQSIPPLKN